MSPEVYREKIGALIGLPTLPTIAMEIQQIMREDQLSVTQTIPILEQDPSLAMKILKVANSAYYGMEYPVESLRQAVVVLGMRELAGVALGFSILKAMSRPGDESELNWKRFWEHSVAVAHLCEFLDDELGIHTPHSPYSLGLLHDIGKLVLFRLDEGLYTEARNYAKRERTTDDVAEEHFYGLNHCEAGNLIAIKWGLSEAIQSCMLHHHNPNTAVSEGTQVEAALVHLANYVANLRGMNFGMRQLLNADAVPVSWEILSEKYVKVKNRTFEDFLLDMDEHWGTVREMISLLDMS